MVKCWDLESNRVIRHYHGHLSECTHCRCIPILDVLVTWGRDGVARIWDMRTRTNVMILSGHQGTVSDVKCQDADPQVNLGLWSPLLWRHTAQPGSLDAEQGVFCSTFDKIGEADKTIKEWKQDDGATEDPLNWKPSLRQRKY
ncbi:hypothetical protein L211DRAFT_845371 [Terfezia boudieri ATCC MYA-4762]|uniref:Pre-mRNA-splicing factor PRP46 n=1 Tax=Terfezia boudieri ATCC MYA-4762 TaxID=1051890 RepID=A0A3N4LZM8_9PEZI|nr:hypothetical protein L211DRAFT_845371 [Terfezia boudieri ATCC MYA-4762]